MARMRDSRSKEVSTDTEQRLEAANEANHASGPDDSVGGETNAKAARDAHEELAPQARDDGDLALTSLQRLEDDIQQLHARWADVEDQLATRDMKIARLKKDYQAQVSTAQAETELLRHELQKLRRESERTRQDTLTDADNAITALSEALGSTREDANGLQQQLNATEQQLSCLQSELEQEGEQFDELWEAAQGAEKRLGKVVDERDSLRERLSQLEFEFAEFTQIAALDLEISAERNAELEEQLKGRDAALRSLDKNVRMMDEINAKVQRLDKQISASDKIPNSMPEAGPSRVRRLMVAVHDDKTIRFPIYKTCMTIGRSHHADIQVLERGISRRHARIVVDDTTVTIEDLGSKNGMLINNEPVHASELHNEDIVEIGGIQLQFVHLMDLPGAHAS